MSLFRILEGDSSRISTDVTPFHEGYAYFTPDDGKFYIDSVVDGVNKRICINSEEALKEVQTTLAGKQDASGAVQFTIPSDETQWNRIVNYKYGLSANGVLVNANNEKLVLTDDQGEQYAVRYVATKNQFYKARADNGMIMNDENDSPIVLSGFELIHYCDVPVQDLAVGDRVDVTIDPASIDDAVTCGFSPVTESLDGVFRLFASDIPSGDIPAQYWVTRAKEGAASSAYGLVNVPGKIDPANIGAASKKELEKIQTVLDGKQDASESILSATPTGKIWAAVNNSDLSYRYIDIDVEGLESKDRVDVMIAMTDMGVVKACGLYPFTDSFNGKFRMYANKAPSSSFSFYYWVTKGKKGVSSSARGLINVPGKIDPASIGAVPTTRTINSKALSANVTLTASDVGAASMSDLATKQDASGAVAFTIPYHWRFWSPFDVANSSGEIVASYECCTIQVEGLTYKDRVDVIIMSGSTATAQACRLHPFTQSSNGEFMIFADSSPIADIPAYYWVTKAKESATSIGYGLVNVPGPSVTDLTKKVEEMSKTVALLDHAIFMVPSPVADLTSTGSLQSPTWNNFNPEQLTISGETSRDLPGTYTAIFTPVEGYHWIDGTTAPKSVGWKIVKNDLDLS